MAKSEVLSYRDALKSMREILFANVVMAGEIPAPTGAEHNLTRFLSDRFTECGLDNIAGDEAGNVAGVMSGTSPGRNLLVAAHLDKIWPESDDHTVSVGVGEMSGRGIADNSLGIAVLASLPLILGALEVRLESNLILLGTSRSFGRGNIGGMRFFLDNSERTIESALCIEGIDLGRVSYKSLGMARGEITLVSEINGEHTGSLVGALAESIDLLLGIDRRERENACILIGGVDAGSGFNVPPRSGTLRFEIRSESASKVAAIEDEIVEAISRTGSGSDVSASVEMVARRRPGRLPADHRMVSAANSVLADLGIEPHDEPSISELAALLEKKVPALTLGITRGQHRHSPEESIQLEPIFDGVAQIVSVLRVMDAEGPDL